MYGVLDEAGKETEVVNRLVDFDGQDVLEIGCGDGRLTWRFAERTASVLALDPIESDIVAAKKNMPDTLRSKVTFRCEDIRTAKLEEESFDVAVFSWSL